MSTGDEKVPSEQNAGWRAYATAFAPAIAGLIILGGAFAYYLGYSFERAYAEEWGIPFSAFSYRPHELMLANQFTVLLSILSVVPFVPLIAAPSEEPPRLTYRYRRVVLGAILVSS